MEREVCRKRNDTGDRKMTIGKRVTNVLMIGVVSGLGLMALPSHADSFYPISSVTSDTAADDYLSATNLIEGAGVGFDASAPHDRLGDWSGTWVTEYNGTDYFSSPPTPSARLVFDLGKNVALSEISVWGYEATNANGVRQFNLRFATEADGTGGFGTSITLNPSFTIIQDSIPRQICSFSTVHARYVELTPTDNFYGLVPAGGDRVGLGEVAFASPPPTTPGTLIYGK
jgi:hypothetical protein